MRKYSLFTFTILLPLVVAVICAIYATRAATMRRQAEIHFHKLIDEQVYLKYSTGIDELVAAHGPENAARIVDAKAKQSSVIAFDGATRLAKIVRQTKEWKGPDPAKTGYSDGLLLKGFGHAPSAVWDGPMGTRISSVRFDDDNLIVSIYGHLQLDSSTRTIPQESPEEYILPWPKGSQPSSGSIYNDVMQRQLGDEKKD